ncbi:polyphosphate kinase 1 [Haloferax mediterranei ATCC 33500]|uniref:Polyphosphate kinase n=1 Tax=Haloferax mediterranei (strain ATCC 33500 / DSM 1411 / JCM 8866 / NBRC 14739 / NCIMB 2177 / R-4) TaxID=523841 RepID=I3R5D6_HALMT|nr:polyphosphate kinase 1 [Haloferax mediterranei]AFK19446.1 polyphosphate kinase [Haloferax mediterranei ATCC 33500]AHZ21205.1 polyphosphate kinase [Haloferax mediterranei ATCC 33500]EMA04365.1 polyphosphate kinase [Haloferax mediterranei ATCC 33500]MDX5989549.1 polyphosphate kinase 1 [Haloferax mediterranei ATCC 33500]QCQ75907.1 polyphosphate kinase 1 [Haloferax mediterranei ATCC 33500]
MTDESTDTIDLSDPQYYLNRELSQLEFQSRVLNEALDDRNPLLERVRFLAIFTKNLDEFFMKRVGGLKQQIDAGVTEQTTDGRTPQEQWEEVIDKARPLFERQAACYREEIRPALAAEGIHICDYDDLTPDQQSEMREYFEVSVLPVLTPLSFDPAHPFPFISNLSLSLAVITRGDDSDDDLTFTRVKIPQNRPRLVEVETDGDEVRYVLLEAIIRANLDLLFPNVEVVDTAVFKLTRNAEVRRNEEVAEDLIDMIEEVLDQRRFATAVRLEIEADAPESARELLIEQLDLDEREVFELRGPLDYREFMDLTDLSRPDLSLDSWTPQPHSRFADTDADDVGGDGDTIFDEIRRKDVLLHHPYHSFGDTVQEFLDAAANDPNVLAIKAAIYRTASDSKIIESLIDAVDNGKQVAAMVELKARFDEQNNLEWVHKLEEEGIHVAYGTIGLKTHTKTALVVREEEDGVCLYSHVATGNYHSGTAKGYVDLGVLTADRDIGQDLVKVFNFFTGPSLDEEFRKLLIAPVTMRNEFTKCIRREAEHAAAGRPARIVAKMNALEDPGIVEELYKASMAGVDIDLLVRDICRLRPGIEGLSETVTVRSVVDRFLEHSRIFYFENAGDPEYYVGSADWMTRNLDKRVEAIAPVEDPDIREQLRFILELGFADNRKSWEMNADGSYDQLSPENGHTVTMQSILMNQVLGASSRPGVHRGMPASHPDVPETLLVESSPTVMTPRDVPEPRSLDTDTVSVVTKRTTVAETVPSVAVAEAIPSVAAATGAPSNGDAQHVLDEFPEKWYVPNSGHYEYAVRTPDGDRDYRKTAAAAAKLIEKYYDSDAK